MTYCALSLHSLTTFSGANEETDLLPIEELGDMKTVADESKKLSKGESGKDRKGNKRKASALSNDASSQEPTDSFPISTTASTQPI